MLNGNGYGCCTSVLIIVYLYVLVLSYVFLCIQKKYKGTFLTECYLKFKTQFIMKNQSQKFSNNNILTIENKSPETCFAPVFSKILI